MHQKRVAVTGGVDTHRDTHVAAVVDEAGRILGVEAFPATAGGYGRLLAWMASFGTVERVGIEATGSYGAGLARHLASEGVTVVEVNRPNRQWRRRRGKSDPTDAEAAARAALCGEASAVPKAADGPVEALRALRVARRSAMKARTQAANQLAGLAVTAPEQLRAVIGGLTAAQLVERCGRFRPAERLDPLEATKVSMRSLARRHADLDNEIRVLDRAIAELCAQTNPGLLGAKGVGPDVASALLVAAGDNPERMRTEAAFAALCGTSPVQASSGRVTRHRLNRGGNREANNALWRIVMVRLSCDPKTRAYAQRRTAQGKTTKEILRCLKRYVAREIYQLLTHPAPAIDGQALRHQRTQAGITLATPAGHLATWPTRISELERGLLQDHDLATRYQHWLNHHAPANA